MHREWFEPALARELGPVAAPEELWERVCNPGPRPAWKPGLHATVNAARFRACATVACAGLVVLLAVWAYPSRREFRSGDAGQIRAWVRANAGVDVPLRSHLPAELRLTGARVVNGTAEIAYRVNNRECLVVNRPSMARHRFSLSCTSPGDIKVACSLCHIG